MTIGSPVGVVDMQGKTNSVANVLAATRAGSDAALSVLEGN